MVSVVKNNWVVWFALYIFIFLVILFGSKLVLLTLEEREKNKKNTNSIYNHSTITVSEVSDNEYDEQNENYDNSIIEVSDISKKNEDFDYLSLLKKDNFKKSKSLEPRKETKGRSRKEKLCREIFEEIYNDDFPSIYPKFLLNPKTGYKLELDGYNKRLGIAFEYNGIQHYQKVPIFHKKGNKDLIYQASKDNFKKKRCHQNGVYLISIPFSIKDFNLKKYIKFYLPEAVEERQRLNSQGYNIPMIYENFNINKKQQ